MNFEEKVLNFLRAIANCYKSEDNQDIVQTMPLNDENITEDITAILYGFCMFYKKVTGNEIDILDFTYLLNKLAFQSLTDRKEDEGK